MKKLMIAAGVAAAMTGSVYATKGCKDCGNIVVQQVEDPQVVMVDDCFTEVYNVQFKLKTLASKGVKSGDCQGWCMEQGTRTIDGILWSCCSDCANWAGNQEADWNFQYCLWEKSSKTLFTDGLTHLNGQGQTTTGGFRYTMSARYLPSGRVTLGSGFVYDDVGAATFARDQQIALLNAQWAGAGFANLVAPAQQNIPLANRRYGYAFRFREAGGLAPIKEVDKKGLYTFGQLEAPAADLNSVIRAFNAELDPDGAVFATAAYPNADGHTWLMEVYDTTAATPAWIAAVAPQAGAAGDQAVVDALAGYGVGGQPITTTVWDAKWGYAIQAAAGFIANPRGSDCDQAKALDAAKAKLPANGLTAQEAFDQGYYATLAAAQAANIPDAAITWTLVPDSENLVDRVADAACENVDPGFRSRYLDTQANIAVYRYGKKADKAEALWVIDTENDAQAGAGLKDENNLLLTAAGFGTVAMDKDYEQYYVKSPSGNCAGAITPLNVAADCAGAIISMCDELGSWCTDGWVATIADTFASGTWTMKYIANAKNGIWGLVPSYAK